MSKFLENKNPGFLFVYSKAGEKRAINVFSMIYICNDV